MRDLPTRSEYGQRVYHGGPLTRETLVRGFAIGLMVTTAAGCLDNYLIVIFFFSVAVNHLSPRITKHFAHSGWCLRVTRTL